jgi:transcriptional regulator with XRE-family HTH domain
MAVRDGPTATELQAGFARRLKQARLWRGYRSQRAFADKLGGVSHDAVRTWESGRNYPSQPQILRIVETLGISADWLLFGKPTGLDSDAYKALITNALSLVKKNKKL